MSFVHIKKIQQRDPQLGVLREVYAVPSVAIVTPQGKKLIPNPSGQEATLFDTLEEAQQAVRLAGFDFEYEGKKTYTLNAEEKLAPSAVHSLEDGIPSLIRRLQDREATVVANAAFALGALRATQALEPLTQCLGHDDPGVRKHVAEALARMGNASLSFLRDAFQLAKTGKDKNAPYVRLTVMLAYVELAQTQPYLVESFLPQVLEGLEDESWLVRTQAALVVGNAALARQMQEFSQ